jgi:hypothetical protein
MIEGGERTGHNMRSSVKSHSVSFLFVILLLSSFAATLATAQEDVRDEDDDCPDSDGESTEDRVGCPDRDGDGWSDPDPTGRWGENWTVGDGADAYPDNPDIHDPVLSVGCDPPSATLDIGEPVIFICTVSNKGPVEVPIIVHVIEDEHTLNKWDGAVKTLKSDGEADDSTVFLVKLEGYTSGVATATFVVESRLGKPAVASVELPIRVTEKQWEGIGSHSEGLPPPDVTGLYMMLDRLAEQMSEWLDRPVSRGQTGISVLLTVGMVAVAIRSKRARSAWKRNRSSGDASDSASRGRFEKLRGGPDDLEDEGQPRGSGEIVEREDIEDVAGISAAELTPTQSKDSKAPDYVPHEGRDYIPKRRRK